MKFRFTRTVADVTVAVGIIIIIAGAALAIAAFVSPAFVGGFSPLKLQQELGPRAAGALLIFALGFLVGAVFVVQGQLVLVFLDMRARLARIERRLRNRDEARASLETEGTRRRL